MGQVASLFGLDSTVTQAVAPIEPLETNKWEESEEDPYYQGPVDSVVERLCRQDTTLMVMFGRIILHGNWELQNRLRTLWSHLYRIKNTFEEKPTEVHPPLTMLPDRATPQEASDDLHVMLGNMMMAMVGHEHFQLESPLLVRQFLLPNYLEHCTMETGTQKAIQHHCAAVELLDIEPCSTLIVHFHTVVDDGPLRAPRLDITTEEDAIQANLHESMVNLGYSMLHVPVGPHTTNDQLVEVIMAVACRGPRALDRNRIRSMKCHLTLATDATNAAQLHERRRHQYYLDRKRPSA